MNDKSQFLSWENRGVVLFHYGKKPKSHLVFPREAVR